MPDLRALVAAPLVFVALVLQLTLITRLPWPGGIAPDLVLVVVAALALRMGVLYGSVIGFCAGVVADIVPPAYHTVGRYALVYCLIGYLVGLFSEEVEDSALLSVAAVSVGALCGMLLYTLFGAIFGDPRITGAALTRVLPLSVLYDVVISPFVLYVVAKLLDRADPERSGRRRLYGTWPSP